MQNRVGLFVEHGFGLSIQYQGVGWGMGIWKLIQVFSVASPPIILCMGKL